MGPPTGVEDDPVDEGPDTDDDENDDVAAIVDVGARAGP